MIKFNTTNIIFKCFNPIQIFSSLISRPDQLIIKFYITLTLETKFHALFSKVRPLPAGSKKAILGKEAFQELIDLDIVEPVDLSQPTLWSSPLHLQLKPSGQYRPCGDFRALNQKTAHDSFPLPNLRSFSANLKGSRMFSKLDMTKAYHHIPINPSDRHKTTVLTPWGAYQFKMMAMGLSNASQSFQRYITFILRDIPNLFIYLDDVLVHAKDKAEHDKILKQVLMFVAIGKFTSAVSQRSIAI